MTRALTAAAALLVASCAARAPSTVTVAPVTTKPTPPPELIGARYDDLGCNVFAKDGPAPDEGTYRSCLEREAPKAACEGGSSPDLATLELAVALVDGTGGEVGIPRARAMLARCFADVSVQAVLEHATKKEKDPMTPPLASCESYAQTTLAMTDCALELTKVERGWLRRIELDLAPDTRRFFADASRAFAAYAEKVGEIDYTRYAGGSTRSADMSWKILSVTRLRRIRVLALRVFIAKRATGEDLASARDEVERALSVARHAEPNAAEAVDAAEKAWSPYRDAELAFYERMFPGSRDAVTLLLEREHAKDLCSSVPP
jgi:hypothetical protein